MKKHNTGFTLTELLIVVAIIAILAVLAVPSFQNAMRAQRAEGAAEAFLAALQNAKMEAIKTNSDMRIAFSPATLNTAHNTWCYGMTQPGTTTCDCNTANSCAAGSVVRSTDYAGVSAKFNNYSYRLFTSLRGTSNTSGTVTFNGGNNKTLGVRTSTSGRNRICRPDSTTMSSYHDNPDC
ncbi:GspH/FimT family pseudopilin [Methylomicrobium lacus]|uniref:GspH/FimT family pseudopilin n=1 Tax=Methylomicrobium lacus TaxID=136992 RepID=UPI0035A8D4B5